MDKLTLLKGVRAHLSDPAHWHQGAYAPGGCVNIPKGCVCLMGAASYVADPNRDYERSGCNEDAEQMLEDALLPCLTRNSGVIGFNDAPSTTHEDVLKVLDCAIAKAEGPIS